MFFQNVLLRCYYNISNHVIFNENVLIIQIEILHELIELYTHTVLPMDSNAYEQFNIPYTKILSNLTNAK